MGCERGGDHTCCSTSGDMWDVRGEGTILALQVTWDVREVGTILALQMIYGM